MKYLLIVVALIVAVILAAMYVPIKDGRTLLDASELEGIGSQLQEQAGMDSADEMAQGALPPGTLYRWKDSSGNWQYSDRPPAGVDAEPVTLKQTQRLENLPSNDDAGSR